MAASVGDLRSLPLAPVDGFILTRVNGAATIREIAAQTGLPEDAVAGSLTKLLGLGVVEFPGEVRADRPPAPPAALPPAPQPPPADGPRARPGPPAMAEVMALGPATYDRRELDEECDLEPDEKKRILDLFYRLDDVNYYQLLGVARTADKKAVKRSYFELAAHFHPDKHFRKQLGAYKQKMELIFGKVTEAHDTLTSKERRPEYDQYLEVQEQARGIEAMMATAQADAQRAREELRALAEAESKGRHTPSRAFDPRREDGPFKAPPPPAPSQTGDSPPPMRPPSASQPEIHRPPGVPVDPREAREALARRLRGHSARPPPKPPATPSVAPPSTTQDAMDALKRRYEDRRGEAAKAQAAKYKNAGDQARASKDMISAANAYRVAMGFDGEDPEIQHLFKISQEAADLALADTYMKQASYEERNGHWTEAARSWGRVAKAKPDNAGVHDKLANAILHAKGNLHEAAAAAKHAIEYGSAVVQYRLTLVNVYVAAGLIIAAKRELEQASRMEPGNAAVAALAKHIEKAG